MSLIAVSADLARRPVELLVLFPPVPSPLPSLSLDPSLLLNLSLSPQWEHSWSSSFSRCFYSRVRCTSGSFGRVGATCRRHLLVNHSSATFASFQRSSRSCTTSNLDKS